MNINNAPIIKVRIEKVWGQERIYICDPEEAATIQKLTGGPTVTRSHLDALKNMGFEIEVETPKL